VIDAGEEESGCTIHEVTEQVDGGPIVVQKKVKVRSEGSSISELPFDSRYLLFVSSISVGRERRHCRNFESKGSAT
jgi:hypothetical protein